MRISNQNYQLYHWNYQKETKEFKFRIRIIREANDIELEMEKVRIIGITIGISRGIGITNENRRIIRKQEFLLNRGIRIILGIIIKRRNLNEMKLEFQMELLFSNWNYHYFTYIELSR